MKIPFLVPGLFTFCIGFLLVKCSPLAAPDSPLRIRWTHDPETLDPMALPNQFAVDANNLLHYSLLQNNYSQQVFAPALVESLPTVHLVGDSLTLLDYKLRTAATWDDGQPVLAHDVDFTLKLMHCPGLPNEAARSQFSFIRALRYDNSDPRRFTMYCQGQAPEFAQSSGDFFILSEAALDPQQRLRQYSLAQLRARTASAKPDSVLTTLARRYLAATSGRWPGYLPGCGPYQLVAWEKNQFLQLRRKSSWWGKRIKPTPFVLLARPAQLQFAIIPDDATASLALQRGELDVYPQVPVREFARLQRLASAKSKLRFYTAPSYDVVTAGFNTRRPALADAGTRQALSRLFDAAGLLKATQQAEGLLTVGLISPTDQTNYNDSLPLLHYSPTEAAVLLRRAGWQQGIGTAESTGWQRRSPQGRTERLTLSIRYRADETSFETAALQFKAAAAQLGIPVHLQPTESAVLTASLQAGDFDVYIRTIRGNPFIFNFAPILHSRSVGEGNLTGYGTPSSDSLIEAIVTAGGPTRKARLLRKLQTRLRVDAPLVPLFFLPMRIAAARNLTDLHVTGLKPGFAAAAISRVAEPIAQ
ncbi:ABC transporter substrate-binding protein [Hymenobacter terrenus]|uniref:ABC transporter substrate-binding protein n=1 Tax=Hymenobacter terrenus TaxID=1629124 RepID=UPI00061993E2|nr:ABC transporter substrate-binding protein [Hymenobacter terrenus]